MPELIGKIPQQFKEFWGNLDKSNRTKLIITSAIVFLSVLIAVVVVSKPQYQPLFSHLDPKDIGEIGTQLEKLNIDYKLENNGQTILVKKQDLNKAKVSLAQVGYPKKGMTFDDLNKTSLGTTDSERRKRYQLFKEGELERALIEMDNVENAIVKLTTPEQTAFFNTKEILSKASVIIHSYDELTVKQINGIQRFIAGSVENLEPKNVTVLDNNGNILNEEYDPIAGNADRQYALKQSVTKNVEKQVRDLLFGVNGVQNVRVMANLELDFDALVTNTEIYEPVIDGKGIIRSSQEKKETVVNGTAPAAPGTDTNPSQYPNVGTGETGEYKLTEKSENYEVNKTVTQLSKEIGKMDKENSSIAVAMYKAQTPAQPDGNEVASVDIDRDKVKDMVAFATGIPVDRVTVEVLEMAPINDFRPSMDIMQMVERFGPLVLVLLLIGLLVIVTLKVRGANQPEPLTETSQLAFNAAIRQEEPVQDIDLEEKSQVKRQLDKFVKQKPEAVAQLLRNWIAEDWD